MNLGSDAERVERGSILRSTAPCSSRHKLGLPRQRLIFHSPARIDGGDVCPQVVTSLVNAFISSSILIASFLLPRLRKHSQSRQLSDMRMRGLTSSISASASLVSSCFT